MHDRVRRGGLLVTLLLLVPGGSLGYDDPEELRRALEDAGITSGGWPEDTATA